MVIFNPGVLLLAGFVLLAPLLGCGGDKKPKSARPDKNACKTVEDRSLNQQKAIQKSTVTINRKATKINYINCEQSEFLKQKQLVRDATSVELAVKANFKADESQMSVSVYNRTNCESGNFRTRSKSGTLTIPVSVDKSTKHLRLSAVHDNYIDYEIRECAKVNAEFHCTESEVVEQGTLVLAVKFTDVQVSDTKEITVCRRAKRKVKVISSSDTSLP